MPLFEFQHLLERQSPDKKQRVRVAPPQALHLIGPTLRVVISVTKEHEANLVKVAQPTPEPVPGGALIDTGASFTCVADHVCQKLGLQPTGMVTLGHAGGKEDRLCYPIQVSFPGSPLPPLYCPRACSVNLAEGQQGHIMLIGRDLLRHFRMVYNGPRGRIELDF